MHYVNNNTGQQTPPLYANPPPKTAQADGGGGNGHPLPNNPRQSALSGQNLAPRNDPPPQGQDAKTPEPAPQAREPFRWMTGEELRALRQEQEAKIVANMVHEPGKVAWLGFGNPRVTTAEVPKQEAKTSEPAPQAPQPCHWLSLEEMRAQRQAQDAKIVANTVPDPAIMSGFRSNIGPRVNTVEVPKQEVPKQEAPLVEMGNIGNSSSSSGSSSSNTIKVRVASKPQTQPDYTYTTSSQMPIPTPVSSPIAALPQAHLSNVAHTVPGMNLSGPTGDVANMAFQAGAEGTQMAETGMTAGMGQLGQVMTLGIKQQVEMALMKQATDIAGAVAKELRNVSKNVKDMAGS